VDKFLGGVAKVAVVTAKVRGQDLNDFRAFYFFFTVTGHKGSVATWFPLQFGHLGGPRQSAGLSPWAAYAQVRHL
jgi:hypothetical protein